MSRRPGPNPPLRLVGADAPAGAAPRARVRSENVTSGANPALDPTDPRWTLAVHAHAQLQGTAMTPERRGRVLRTARALGMRPFDANVIIAIAQDRARRGEDLAGAASMLALLPAPARDRRPGRAATWCRWIAAVAAAAAVTALLVHWLLS